MVIVDIGRQFWHLFATEHNYQLFVLTESSHAPIGASLSIENYVIIAHLVILVGLTLSQHKYISIVI